MKFIGQLLVASFFCMAGSAELIAGQTGSFRISIEPATIIATLGEPLYVTLVVENGYSEDVRGAVRNDTLAFVFTSPGGAVARASAPRYVTTFADSVHPEGNFDIAWKLLFKPNETYKLRVLLNEFYSFPITGNYSVEVGIPSNFTTVSGRSIKSESPIQFTVQLRERDGNRLRTVCTGLARNIVSGLPDSPIEAAKALRYIEDPIAVPFQSDILKQSVAPGYKQQMIEALARIGTAQSVDALIENLMTITDAEVVSHITAVLRRTEATTSMCGSRNASELR